MHITIHYMCATCQGEAAPGAPPHTGVRVMFVLRAWVRASHGARARARVMAASGHHPACGRWRDAIAALAPPPRSQETPALRNSRAQRRVYRAPKRAAAMP